MKRETRLWSVASIGIAVCIMIMAFYFYSVFKKEKVKAPADTREVQIEMTNELTVTVYASCPCSICNTKRWEGKTKKGLIQKFKDQGINICAVDPNVIPLDSRIVYDDKEYVAKDVGKDIKGNTICILMDKHSDTLKFGVKKEQKIVIKE